MANTLIEFHELIFIVRRGSTPLGISITPRFSMQCFLARDEINFLIKC